MQNEVTIEIKIKGYTKEETDNFREIFHALLTSGGLSGVKNGKTVIHFDAEGVFQGVQLDYWPWRRRKETKPEGPVIAPRLR